MIFRRNRKSWIDDVESYANGYADVRYAVDELIDFAKAGDTSTSSYIWSEFTDNQKDIAFFYLVNKVNRDGDSAVSV